MRRRVILLLFLAVLPGACAGPAYDLLVQGALDSELGPLLSSLEAKQETHVGAWTFWTGRIGTKKVVISRTEMGPINAVAATTIGIQTFHPRAIINQGTAGAHNPGLRLWDIVVGEKTTDYAAFRSDHGDEGSGMQSARWRPMVHKLRINGELKDFPSFPGDPQMAAAALAVKYERGRVLKGNIGSAFEFNREIDRINWLRKTYGTDVEDMESAYSAGVAVAFQVPFVAIRIISDSEFNHPTFEKIAGEYCAQFTVDVIKSLP